MARPRHAATALLRYRSLGKERVRALATVVTPHHNGLKDNIRSTNTRSHAHGLRDHTRALALAQCKHHFPQIVSRNSTQTSHCCPGLRGRSGGGGVSKYYMARLG